MNDARLIPDSQSTLVNDSQRHIETGPIEPSMLDQASLIQQSYDPCSNMLPVPDLTPTLPYPMLQGHAAQYEMQDTVIPHEVVEQYPMQLYDVFGGCYFDLVKANTNSTSRPDCTVKGNGSRDWKRLDAPISWR